jgi:hypothetical protein
MPERIPADHDGRRDAGVWSAVCFWAGWVGGRELQ